MQRYLDRVVATATAKPRVRKRLLSVMNMLAGPQALLNPSVIGAVIGHVLAPGRAPALWPGESPDAFETELSPARAALRV